MRGFAGDGLLRDVRSPADLRALPQEQLAPLAQELRDYLIDEVSRGGGHLAAGLGTVELTIALHRIFETPNDLLVWDVGHQCYPHKVLTGRGGQLGQIRKRGGLSGFLRRDESAYDTFGAGHSSTSISAALGMAVASAQLGRARKTVAIIGDGAMTAGLAYEALDHAGVSEADLLVILNDNQMSISPNVGGLSRYLSRGAAADHGRFFEALGVRYFGPVDGHDLPRLLAALTEQRSRKGPRLLHVVTRKGCGYAPAEKNPIKYHGVTSFDPAVGIVSGAGKTRTYTDVFGEWLCEMAERDERLVAITPAMREGSGLTEFAARFPHRYFDVGIAEQHCVTFAAGLAAQGLRPVVAIYSTFLQRAYDQVVHDVATQNLPVTFCIDRGGLVAEDGTTHHGAFDFAYLRHVPNMVVMAPKDENELQHMVATCLSHNGPASVRYPRGVSLGVEMDREPAPLPIGKGEVLKQGTDAAIVAVGVTVWEAFKAAQRLEQEGISTAVLNARFVKPLDAELLSRMAKQVRYLVTVEEGSRIGGFGSAVLEMLSDQGITHLRTKTIGLPDWYIEQGPQDLLRERYGLTAEGIYESVKTLFTQSSEERAAEIEQIADAMLSVRGRRESPGDEQGS